MLFVVKLHEDKRALSFEHDAYKWVDIKTAFKGLSLLSTIRGYTMLSA